MEGYKKRFIIEYYELSDRIEKLDKVINSDLQTTCATDLLQHQLDVMRQYKAILSKRANIEDIKLED